MADKYHSDTKEKIESIIYQPSLKNTGDLEAATRTIAATSEASGIGNADYSAAITLTTPSDVRLVIKRITARLAVTIDSFDAATSLYCRVYVDQQDADHRLFDEVWTTAAAQLVAVDTHSAALSTIFDLLKDGAEHTFYFFFWIDQANNAVISLVQLQEAVGSCDSPWYSAGTCLQLDYAGLVSLTYFQARQGTGTPGSWASWGGSLGGQNRFKEVSGANVTSGVLLFLANSEVHLRIGGSVDSDINYISSMEFVLRSEQ